MPGTKRQQELRKALRLSAPLIPYDEAMAVLAEAGSARMKRLPPAIALWLTLTAHVRHRHTEYDALLAEGYERDAARHFVIDATDAKLTEWGCARRVADDAAEDAQFLDGEAGHDEGGLATALAEKATRRRRRNGVNHAD